MLYTLSLERRVEELEQKLTQALVALETEKDLVATLVLQLESLIEAEIGRRSHSSWKSKRSRQSIRSNLTQVGGVCRAL